MEFYLTYQGLLKSNRGPRDKQMIRRAFHPQLRELTKYPPYPKKPEGLVSRGDFTFAPIVNKAIGIGADVSITMLRPEAPGHFVMQGGDIDNKVKTLLDAFSVPQDNQILKDDHPVPDESPLFCLLEDDNLITSLEIKTGRLLVPTDNPSEVFLMIHVRTRSLFTNYFKSMIHQC